jgi:diaminopimelate decarboxylase
MDAEYNFKEFLNYKDCILHIDGIPYTQVLELQSPTVCISLSRVKENIDIVKNELRDVKHSLHYALKASYFKPLVLAIREHGIGVEVISEYEWKLAMKAGFRTEDIVMNGLGRTAEEMIQALKSGSIVNIDSLSELKKLIQFKGTFHNGINIGLRIHPLLSEDGNFVKRDGKLGMDYREARECVERSHQAGIHINGFSCHVFSNQTNAARYGSPIKALSDFIRSVENEFQLQYSYIDIGGGIAPRMLFSSDHALRNFMKEIVSDFKKYFPSDVKMLIEPGRYIVADAVVIFSRIKTIKINEGGTWAVLDIGTNYLIPALGSDFKVVPCEKGIENSDLPGNVKFVDGICSPAGFISEAKMSVREGQVVAVTNCGAYTSVMREEFVLGTPRHVYLDRGRISSVVKQTSFEEFAQYHGW